MSVINEKSLNIAKNFLAGSLRLAEFALTNVCVAKCTFCDIWKQKPKVFVNREKTFEAINRLADFGVSHITFTGGEPLLHPNIIDFISLATKRRIHSSVLDADPRLLMKGDILRRLEDAGSDLISISFDSGDPVTMAKSRNIENIMDEMKRALEMIKRTSLQTMASVLIWNDNYDKLDNVCDNAHNMGYDFISFNYPTFSDSSVYVLGGEGINFSRDKVVEALESAIELKKSGKYNIINSVTSMRNIINYLKDPSTVKFACFGGSRVMFVDWFFNVYPCMQLPKPIGNIFDLEVADLSLPPCNMCNMSWYRDFSTYFCGVKSIPPLFESLASLGRIL